MNPTQATDTILLSSIKIIEAPKEAILQQDFQYSGEVVAQQLEAKMEVQQLKRRQASERISTPLPQTVNGPCPRKRSLILANFPSN